MPYDERFYQQNGFLHGGAVASLVNGYAIATMTSTIIIRSLRRP